MWGEALVLSGVQEQLQERLTPLRSWLFPSMAYLELEDRSITVLAGQRSGGAFQADVLERVQLPVGLCDRGEPLRQEAVGDFIGDLLIERDLNGVHVRACLPAAASQWKLVQWPGGEWPQDPDELLIRRGDDSGFSLPIQAAYTRVIPLDTDLTGGAPTSLVVAVRQSVLQAWIETLAIAGVTLDGLEAAQVCELRALEPLLRQAPASQLLAVLSLRAEAGRLLLVRRGLPLYEHAYPADSGAVELAEQLRRSIDFTLQQDSSATGVRLLVHGTKASGALIEQLASLLPWPVELLDPVAEGWIRLKPDAEPDDPAAPTGLELLRITGLALAEAAR